MDIAGFTFGALNDIGINPFYILIPFVILYLIRPRPKMMDIPSLMFFMTEPGKRRKASFLRRFTRDWLFLIQLIIFTILAASVLYPFIVVPADITSSHTVIVLDVSASMQTLEGSTTRFDMAVSKAKELLGDKTTIILARETPVVGIEKEDIDMAEKYLSGLKPVDTSSEIGSAILEAGEMVGEGKVIVISDFINTEGMPPIKAKNILEGRNIIVEFIQIGGSTGNIGFVEADIQEDSTTIYIKNYNTKEETVPLLVNEDKRSLTIRPGSIEPFSFTTPRGITTLKLDIKDDFPLDDIFTISAPVKKDARVLLISNSPSRFLKLILSALDYVKYDIAEPPIVPTSYYDVYIIDNINIDILLPGTFETILDHVSSGAGLVIGVQEKIGHSKFDLALPVSIDGEEKASSNIFIDSSNRLTRGVDFGTISDYVTASPKKDTIAIATAQNSSIIALKSHGVGYVIYNGISSDSGFSFTPSYPIFWSNLIDFLSQQQDIRTLNYKTGQSLTFSKSRTIVLPDGDRISSDKVALSKQGIYRMEDRNIAVNLANEFESYISTEEAGKELTLSEVGADLEEEQEQDITHFLLIAAAVFLFIELLYINIRGDI